MSKTTIPTGGIADDAVNLTSKVTGALPVANGGTALTSGFLNGITLVDQWRLTSDFAFASGGANTNEQFITANLEQVDTAQQSTFGSAMTESSGVFTFPSTGFYEVGYVCNVVLENDETNFESRIFATTNNSTYVKVASGSCAIQRSSGVYVYSAYSNVILDVTNTSNVKVKFGFKPDVGPQDSVIRADTNYNVTYFTFTRIGDT